MVDRGRPADEQDPRPEGTPVQVQTAQEEHGADEEGEELADAPAVETVGEGNGNHRHPGEEDGAEVQGMPGGRRIRPLRASASPWDPW